MNPNILIAHECSLVKEGIVHILESIGQYSLQCCNKAEDAISQVKTRDIDLLITSFGLPKMGAIELINRISAYSRATRILICANEGPLLVVEKCIQSGAHGYVTTRVTGQELAMAVSVLLSGRLYTEMAISQELALHKIRGDDYFLDTLSPREFDIFLKIIKDKPVKLMAKELFLAEKTVANYVSNIKKKLRAKTNAGLLEIAIKEGFVEYAS